MTLHRITYASKMLGNASIVYHSNGIILAANYVQLFVLRHRICSI